MMFPCWCNWFLIPLLSPLLCLLLLSSQAGRLPLNHTTFIFNQFNSTSDFVLIKSASIRSNLLSLTNDSKVMIGRALYPIPVHMKINNTLVSFSTTFVFSMVPPPSDPGRGHGFAFIVTPYRSTMGAFPAQYLGLFNASSNGQPYNHLFAVDFDTNQNFEFKDINDNHVGVDLNSLTSSASETAGYWIGNEFHQVRFKSTGQNIQAWIDYDHLQDQINVTITLAGLQKPVQPLISVKNTNLSAILQEEMYVGFSAATGRLGEDQYILAWSFTTNGMAPPLDVSRLPSFTHNKKSHKYQTIGFIAGVTVATLFLFSLAILSVFYWLKRTRYRELFEEWEHEFWPHRFSYKELSIATKDFREEEVLGCGGFGRVYKGIIPSSGLEVAVKCITKEVTEGMKEFIAEISSVGRLQHRNLVQLRGWCRRDKKIFIVYDYMPNGSLDKMIFGNPNTVLRWPQRYAILKDVAAGLLYLHEEWEQKVVHRDIKSSNVLLDSELTGKLGDFGLARLYDHRQNPQTTHVVGTLGYIAPDLTLTGKASPSTDVFSYGVMLLEVACGRRPVDPFKKNNDEVVLVYWVRELYAKDKLMDAVDPKLGGDYNVEEMERVLKLGLMCSYPEPEGRLSIRQVLQILEVEAPLPLLHKHSFHRSTISGNILVGIPDIVSSSTSSPFDACSTRSSKGEPAQVFM
eukprot:Gb_41162 [translate_table: standard]